MAAASDSGQHDIYILICVWFCTFARQGIYDIKFVIQLGIIFFLGAAQAYAGNRYADR